jgi:peptide chain release factor 2
LKHLSLSTNSKDLTSELKFLGGFFDIPSLTTKVDELERQSQSNDIWNDSHKAKAILRERAQCVERLESFKKLETLSADTETAFELGRDSADDEFISEALRLITEFKTALEALEFKCKMNGEFDTQNAIVEINAGSGGTEAQDWGDMMLRMYLRWCERKGLRTEIMDYQAGEGAGIKNATILVEGQYAYGYLRNESGVHRLVRISPFDSNARRHTSFASVSVTPDIEEEIAIEINEADLRVDTYRSSGAGGQHVNKTDSAVRLTHIPSGIIVACQSERSQHKNKARAMKILKSKLYEREQEQQRDRIDQLKGQRKKIDFGSQIRNYVMQPYQLVKDLRSDFETSDIHGVLDGELDPIIESCLLKAD